MTATTSQNVSLNAPLPDDEPPVALDKFIEQTGLSPVTVWRWRKAGMLTTLNICGRHYIPRAEIVKFNARAAAGEFARKPTMPTMPTMSTKGAAR